MTTLKIDIKNGLLEVQGEESFVKEIYADYKDAILSSFGRETAFQTKQPMQQFDSSKTSQNPTVKQHVAKSRTGGARKEMYTLVKDLQLSPKGKKSLRDFFAEKEPQTAMEMNTVFVFYLKKEISIDEVTVDHIYTCYKDTSTKVPGALTQSLKDTAHRKGWIDTANTNAISLTTIGENLVEHDLPKQKKEVSK